LIGNAATRVFVTELRVAKSSAGMFISSAIILGVAGTAIYLPIVIIGPVLFSFLLGSEWQLSGEYARALAPVLWVRLLLTPLGNSSPIFGGYQGNLIFSLAGGVLPLFACGVTFTQSHNGLLAVWTYSIAGAIIGLIHLGWLFTRLRRFDISRSEQSEQA
jgi:hypothetical protein